MTSSFIRTSRYAYRLCKNTPGGNVTEECFQKGHLDFAGDTQWLQQWIVPTSSSSSSSSSALATTTIKQVIAEASVVAPKGPTPPPTPPPMQSKRFPLPRVTVTEGTFPAGSQWARIPIPSCKRSGAEMGWANCPADDCAGCCANATAAPFPPHSRINETWWREQDCIAGCADNGLPANCPEDQRQFPEPIPGLSSLWSSWLWCDAPRSDAEVKKLGDSPHDMPCARHNQMMYTNIVDAVQVPASIEPGEYLISWRWDSDQTNQIWQNCGDVTIV